MKIGRRTGADEPNPDDVRAQLLLHELAHDPPVDLQGDEQRPACVPVGAPAPAPAPPAAAPGCLILDVDDMLMMRREKRLIVPRLAHSVSGVDVTSHFQRRSSSSSSSDNGVWVCLWNNNSRSTRCTRGRLEVRIRYLCSCGEMMIRSVQRQHKFVAVAVAFVVV